MHQISFWFFQMGHNSRKGDNSDKKKITCVSYFPSGIHIWNSKTLACTVLRTDARTHGQPETNMPRQLLRSWGHKNIAHPSRTCCKHSRPMPYYMQKQQDAPALETTQHHRPAQPPSKFDSERCQVIHLNSCLRVFYHTQNSPNYLTKSLWF